MGASAGVAAVLTAADSIIDYREKKKQQKANEKLLNQQQEVKEEENEIKKQILKDEKTNLLKTKLASQKAKLGASGLVSTTGSSAAYLSSLEKDTDEEILKKTSLSDLNLLNETANYDYRKKLNLLDQAKNDYDFSKSLVNNIFSKKLF